MAQIVKCRWNLVVLVLILCLQANFLYFWLHQGDARSTGRFRRPGDAQESKAPPLNANAMPHMAVSILRRVFELKSSVLGGPEAGNVSPNNIQGRVLIYDNKPYICTDLRPDHVLSDRDQAPPQAMNGKCFGGVQSWGTCQNGFFLCESAVAGATPSLAPVTIVRCADNSAVPFKYLCIENVCKVSGFRYDPSHISTFYRKDIGILLSCHAKQNNDRKDPELGSTLNHFCDDRFENDVGEGIDMRTKPSLYIPDFAPLNSMVLETETIPAGKFSIELVALTAKPTSKCTLTVTNTAVLTSLDSFNPFHNLLVRYRRLFFSLASFSANTAEAGGMMNCTFVLWRGRPEDSDYTRFAGFDLSFFSSLCRGGILQLSPRIAPVCFQSIIVGAAPGGWDMDLGPKRRGVSIDFSGVTMARWLRTQFGATDSAAVGGAILVVRRGRREMVNENEVHSTLAAAVSPGPLDVVDFDKVNYTMALNIVSRRAAMVGVHGAALSNLIFLPPGAALVEISISNAKTEFFFVAQSFGKLYFEHASLFPIDEHIPDLRDRRINVSNVPELGNLVARAVALVHLRHPSCC